MRFQTRPIACLSTAVAALACSDARADLLLNGTIHQVSGSNYTLDTYNLTVNTAGTIVFNIRAREQDGSNTWADLNGDGFVTGIDGGIQVFAADGNPFSALNMLGANDDSNAAGWNSDGSLFANDPYLSLSLAAGDYRVVFGEWHFLGNYAAINAGEAFGNSVAVYNSTHTTLISNAYAPYELRVTGDVALTAVPEPVSLGLMGLGGITVLRRRRR